MRCVAGFLVVCLVGLPVLAFERAAGIPTQPPDVLVQGEPGLTSFALSWSSRGLEFVLVRSISDRVDVAAFVTSTSPFDLRLRILLVRDLVPLRVETEFGRERALLLGSLHLGPVRLDAARQWGVVPGGWCVVRVSASARVSFMAGARFERASVTPIVGLSWRPRADALWGLTGLFDGRGLALAAGGAR